MDEPGRGDFFEFAGFRFDRAQGCLYRLDRAGGAEAVPLGSRALALLAYLVEREGRLVAKDEIMKAVWPGIAVEDANLTVQISALRRALDRDRKEGSCIQTMSGRGYRFVAPIAGPDPPAPQPPALPLPDKPSIAVLPFRNLSGDPEQEYFADGMVEEIITALSRIRWLFVIAHNSTFIYKGETIDEQQVARQLGVRYILRGSVRKAWNRVRITAQLIDAGTGTHLWADRFDGLLEDVFDLQDEVATSVAGVIGPTLQAAESGRSAQRPTSDLTAYDLYLRAYSMLMGSAKQFPDALRLLEQAIARDPNYGPALAYAGVCCFRLLQDARSDDPVSDRRRAAGFARRALEVGADDPEVMMNAAWVLAALDEDIGAMMALVDRALALNPNSARGWHISGAIRVYAGHHAAAIEHLDRAMRLSPRARVGPSISHVGTALFLSRRFEEAVPKLRLAIEEDPSFPQPYRVLAACYAQMGRQGDAREILDRLRAITADLMPDLVLLRQAEDRDLWLGGLRLAADACENHRRSAAR